MNALSIPDIEALRALALQNASELLAEAELLFAHEKFARAFALAHLSSEELAKLPILASVGVRLANGARVDWKKLDNKLRSHAGKLKGLLFVDLLGTDVDPTARDIEVYQQRLSRVELLNELKNASLYAGVYQGSLYRPSAVVTKTLASEVLTAATNRLELFSAVEATTHGRIVELANCPSYMVLLDTLGVGDDD